MNYNENEKKHKRKNWKHVNLAILRHSINDAHLGVIQMRIKMKINKSVKAVYRKKNLPPSKQLIFQAVQFVCVSSKEHNYIM